MLHPKPATPVVAKRNDVIVLPVELEVFVIEIMPDRGITSSSERTKWREKKRIVILARAVTRKLD
jgi:hypothetical protein